MVENNLSLKRYFEIYNVNRFKICWKSNGKKKIIFNFSY